MAIKIRPGSTIRFRIRLQNKDTLAPIPEAPVFLDFKTAPAAAPEQVAGASTDAQGDAIVSVTTPGVPGSYRYRSRTPGIAERFRADTSADVVVEVVA